MTSMTTNNTESKAQPLGIIFALPIEAHTFERRVCGTTKYQGQGCVMFEGHISDHPIVWTISGVGREAATRSAQPLGIILSGGPASTYEHNAPRCDPGLFSLGVPVLGICYGMQAACEALGGKVGRAEAREYGRSQCDVIVEHSLFSGVPTTTDVWMSHGDQVTTVSDDFIPLAKTSTCPLAAVRHRTLPVFGLQFHPEVTHTPAGSAILANFLMSECGCHGTWRLEDFTELAIDSIRQQVGSKRVIS